ncbi:peptide/nitrate transporter [Ceratobasidium sp. AG-Ba]|nr:peptide/nitrate transporter [Ceratobasidium sp. AG-Ba]
MQDTVRLRRYALGSPKAKKAWTPSPLIRVVQPPTLPTSHDDDLAMSSSLEVLDQESIRCCSPRPPSPAILYEEHDEVSEKPTLQPRATPLPRLQVSILLFMLLSEPCTAAVLLPFINNLVYEVGITHGDKSKVGLCWSDSGLALSSFCFGISKSFLGILISRALAGALNGNAGVIKSVLREVTDETNAASAFAFIPAIWSIGFTLAPALGGLLQHPAETMPNVFGWSSTLKTYPYLLPCAVIALVPTGGLVMGWFFLRETHPVLGKIQAANMYQIRDQVQLTSTVEKPAYARVSITILNYALLSLLDISLVALQPIFASPISLGGLGMEPATIGLLLALQGLVTGTATVIFVPRMQQWFGMRKMYMGGVCLYFVQIWLLPVMHYAIKFHIAGGLGLWVLVGVYAVVSCASPISFCCLLLFISNAPPNAMSLGATNGLAQTSASVMRAIGPAITTALFALSANGGAGGPFLVYMILTANPGRYPLGKPLLVDPSCASWIPHHQSLLPRARPPSTSTQQEIPAATRALGPPQLIPMQKPSAGQPSLFRMLNAAAQYSQILSEDPSESDSDGVQTPASEAAADLPQVQVSLTEDDSSAPRFSLARKPLSQTLRST